MRSFNSNSVESPHRLTALPPKILLEIFKNLHLEDVLCIRRTCQYLSELSKMKVLWTHLVSIQISSTKTSPKIHHLEYKVATYSSQDLEKMCLRWKSAELGWKFVSNASESERLLTLGINDGGSHFLMPGGKWLFAITPSGSITYYDLDSDAPNAKPLIENQPEIAQNGSVLISPPDIDVRSPTLVFNLALILPISASPSFPVETKAFIQIWRIRLHNSDDKKAKRKFVSQQLAAFPHTRVILGIRCVSLSGSKVAISGRDDERYTDVIDWVRATGHSLVYPRRTFRTCYDHVHLLPHNQTFVYNKHTVALFDYSQIREAAETSAPRLGSKHALIWETRIEDGVKPSACSQPFFCSTSVRFVLYNNGTIYGVVIGVKRIPWGPCRIVTLAKVSSLKLSISQGSIPILGYHNALFPSGSSKVMLVVRYSWPDEDERVHSEKRINIRPLGASLRGYAQDTQMDEGTGRIVCAGIMDRLGDTKIVELALYHR